MQHKKTLDILDRLIGFDTTSRNPNSDLIDYVAGFLGDIGARVDIIRDPVASKANLYATIGPTDRPGVLLSGHTDVVPVDGQNWTKPPFTLTILDGRAYGRGTADMKGFLASALNAAQRAATRDLVTPLHLAMSYDEEIGCVGVRSLIDMLNKAPFRPLMCIIGEPTNLQVATGHKGKTGMNAICTGREGHSALAPFAMNALYLACDLTGEIRALQDDFRDNGTRDDDYDVPYTTLHVGKLNGGTALNIVPNTCTMSFEIRNIASDDPMTTVARIKEKAAQIVAKYSAGFPETAIDIEIFNAYPGLDTAREAEVVAFVKSLTGANGTIKVAFGTEGGLFSEKLGIPTVVCGPGSMNQGHKPDEFVTLDQLAQCDKMLDALVSRLATGL